MFDLSCVNTGIYGPNPLCFPTNAITIRGAYGAIINTNEINRSTNTTSESGFDIWRDTSIGFS
jgi:hypothetical protein